MDREDIISLEEGRRAPRPNRGVDDYPYVNARIHALKSALLSRELLLRMLKAENLQEVSSMLSQTGYGQDMKIAEQQYVKGLQLIDVLDNGLKQNFFRCINEIRDFSAGKPMNIIDVLLIKWDAHNLKTIFRGKHSGLPPAEIIKHLFFAGSVKQKELENMARQPDILSVVEALNRVQPVIVKILGKAIDEYAVTGNLMDLEIAIDNWRFKDAIKAHLSYKDDPFDSMAQYLRSEVDNRNFITLLRFVHFGEDLDSAPKFFIRGGKLLDIKKFNDLLKLDSVEKLLKADPLAYGDLLLSKLALYRKMNDVAVFERILESRQMVKVRRVMMQDPLSFNALINFFKAKYDEIINLRLIMRAVEFGIPESVAKEELVLV